MPMELIVKIKRVEEGDDGTKPVVVGGYTGGVFPANGYVVTTNEPNAVPVFVRDEDIERAKKVFNAKGKSVYIEAESWGKND